MISLYFPLAICISHHDGINISQPRSQMKYGAAMYYDLAMSEEGKFSRVEIGKPAGNKSCSILYKSKCFSGEGKAALPRLTAARANPPFSQQKSGNCSD